MTKKESKALAQEILDYAVSKGFKLPKTKAHFNSMFGSRPYFGDDNYDAIFCFDYDQANTVEFGNGEDDGLDKFWNWENTQDFENDKATFNGAISFTDDTENTTIYPISYEEEDVDNDDYDEYDEYDDNENSYYVELPVLEVIDYLPGVVNVMADYVAFVLEPGNKQFIYTAIDKFVENAGKYEMAIKNLKVTKKLVDVGKDFK